MEETVIRATAYVYMWQRPGLAFSLPMKLFLQRSFFRSFAILMTFPYFNYNFTQTRSQAELSHNFSTFPTMSICSKLIRIAGTLDKSEIGILSNEKLDLFTY